MASHPELPVDRVRLMYRDAVVLDDRETNAPAFAGVALALGIIE
jgi:hypothetical protein